VTGRRAAIALALAWALIATSLPAGAASAHVSPEAGAVAAPGGAAAPSTVVRRDYDLGRADLSVLGADGRPHRLPARLVGEITVPRAATGRLPVVVLLHGAHAACAGGPYDGGSAEFPCLPGWEPVESYTGYRYLADRLAGEGFLVISVDGRPVAPFDHTARPFPDGADAGTSTWMDLRARIVDAQLRRLVRAGLGETGDAVDFGVPLAGRVDAGNVGLVGHSRGGEAVVWTALIAGPRPYAVRSIVAIAPTDFGRRVLPQTVPFAVLLPTCDGDVTDLQGADFYDDARNTVRTQPLLQVAIQGANHDFFNTVWPDEWGIPMAGTAPIDISGYCDPAAIGDTRLSRAGQEAVGSAIVSDFLLGTMRGETRRLAALGVGATPPRTIADVPVIARSQEPTAARIDVAPMNGSPYQLAQTADGGRITAAGVEYLTLCRPGAVDLGFLLDTGTSEDGGTPGTCPPETFVQAQVADELRVGWSTRAARLLMPPSTRPVDVRRAGAVSVSVAVTPPDADPDLNSRYGARPFSIVLVDAAGRRARVAVSSAEPAVRWQPTVLVLGTVRIPLARFRGVDLGRIARLEIAFDRVPRGALIVTDVAFVR
jgi:dienelactone hydrolase